MRPFLACLALRTEPGKVVRTDLLADMTLGAQRSQGTEPTVIVLTSGTSSFLADVMVQAIVAVGTVSGAREGLAFGHASEIVLVEIFAFETLLTEPLEEVFADERAVGHRRRDP